MKAALTVLVISFLAVACTEPTPKPTPGTSNPPAGQCLTTAPEGEHCKAGDVWCTSDNHCHSSCAKCK